MADDVRAGTLPAVSWIVAPTKVCEHPDASPSLGEAFSAEIVAALTSDPDVWSKTVLFINYDENDGFFDHVPPPLPAAGTAPGASTVAVDGEVFDGQPVGLGPRVPMIVVSPFSKGGWVNSQIFDHTSVIRFLETRFDVAEPNISPWRRAVTGDLTSAFDFSRADARAPSLPDTSQHATRVVAACKLAKPTVPATFPVPRQEPGIRPARALPYALEINARCADHGLDLDFVNTGAAGAAFNVYEAGGKAGPWFYTVEAGKRLTGTWARRPDAPLYDLTAHGPNGFLRAFRGRHDEAGPDLDARYDAVRERLVITARNGGVREIEIVFTPDEYSRERPRQRRLAAGRSLDEAWPMRLSAHWYDISVTSPDQPDFLRRLAGHIETGAPSFSDPAIGRA